MDTAAAGSGGGKPDTPLEALRWNWGEAYEISADSGGWRARRRDGLGGWMTAPGPDGLRSQIVDDYQLKPVSRPQPGQ